MVGYLVSPTGESVKVINKPSGISGGTYTHIIDLPSGNDFVGDNARGTWKLTMGDYVNADIGTVTSWKLSITSSSSGGTVTPSASSSFNDDFDDLSNWSKSGDDRWNIVST